jgi:DNA processing protein
VEHFGTPQRVLEASPVELARVRGISAAVIASIKGHDFRAEAERECRALERSGARVVDFLSPDYPRLLLQITDPPPLLYLKGATADLDPAIAIVGSRRATQYGISTTTRLARELVGHGCTVISGMARGIDTAAHRGALAASGRTIGVLGCGIDVIYPPENRGLFGEMAERGALLSEFPLGSTPTPANFPRRNRLISGLSRGVLVVEAAERSGSLITARFALEQGREVFAVPGAANSSSSRGSNRLIKEGATLVENATDIMAELPPLTAPLRPMQPPLPLPPSINAQEAAVLALLGEGPRTIDEIGQKGGLTPPELSAMLLRLELRGLVMQLPGKIFSLS